MLGIVPNDFVLADAGFGCVPAVLGTSGGGEVPFHIARSGDKGDVVKVEDSEVKVKFRLEEWLVRLHKQQERRKRSCTLLVLGTREGGRVSEWCRQWRRGLDAIAVTEGSRR